MADILLHISAPRSIAHELLSEDFDGFHVVSKRELAWEDSPRFGLAEGILIIGAIKGLAELGKVILEIVKLLKESDRSDANVRVELPNFSGVTIRSDSDVAEITKRIAKSVLD